MSDPQTVATNHKPSAPLIEKPARGNGQTEQRDSGMEQQFSQRRQELVEAVDGVKGQRRQIAQEKILDQMRLFGDEEVREGV